MQTQETRSRTWHVLAANGRVFYNPLDVSGGAFVGRFLHRVLFVAMTLVDPLFSSDQCVLFSSVAPFYIAGKRQGELQYASLVSTPAEQQVTEFAAYLISIIFPAHMQL